MLCALVIGLESISESTGSPLEWGPPRAGACGPGRYGTCLNALLDAKEGGGCGRGMEPCDRELQRNLFYDKLIPYFFE